MANQRPVRGAKELSKKLRALGQKTGGKVLKSAAYSAMLPVLRSAEASAPVDDRSHLRKTYKGRAVAPGFLSRNIKRHAWLAPGKNYVRVRVGPASEAYYGSLFVELGTSSQAAQPWLGPALERNQGRVLDLFKQKMKVVIEREARKR